MDKFENGAPEFCGHFSVTPDRQFDESQSALKYFKHPELPLNLNEGLNNIQLKPDSYFDEKLTNILTFLIRNKGDFFKKQILKTEPLIPSTKFITYRGVLRLIMCSPYESTRFSKWCIRATKYKGNIYLCQYTKIEDVRVHTNSLDKKRFCEYGPKFQQCCFTDDPSVPPDTSRDVDACSQFFGVFKRNLVGKDFLFAGDINAIDSSKPVFLDQPGKTPQKLKFVSVKVTSSYNFKLNRLHNLWAQSYLTGVHTIYMGLRDYAGFVHQIKQFKTDDLCEANGAKWNPEGCFNFLKRFLQQVEHVMKNVDCPQTVYAFNFTYGMPRATYTIHSGETDLSFLPDWYLDEVKPYTI